MLFKHSAARLYAAGCVYDAAATAVHLGAGADTYSGIIMKKTQVHCRWTFQSLLSQIFLHTLFDCSCNIKQCTVCNLRNLSKTNLCGTVTILRSSREHLSMAANRFLEGSTLEMGLVASAREADRNYVLEKRLREPAHFRRFCRTLRPGEC